MRRVWPIILVAAVFAVLPLLPFGIPLLFPGSFSSPGTLQTMAVALVFAGLAMSYDILFGYTGQLSFGHALPFALGVYVTNLFMIHFQMPYFLALVAAVVGIGLFMALLGSVALRAIGVAFAMVTLAFAEAFHLLVAIDPLRIFGREEGLALASSQLPDFLRGVANTRNVYWLALGTTLVIFLVARIVVRSRAGHVFQAIRENEPRVEMIGLTPFRFKLASFVTATTLAALGGGVYLLVVRGAGISVTTATFTISIVLMVVLGGVGKLWGAALGGFVYGILTLRLSAVSGSDFVSSLPAWIGKPLGEPLFVLGVLFILLMLYAPGGLSSFKGLKR